MLQISKTRRDILYLWKHSTRQNRGGQDAGRVDPSCTSCWTRAPRWLSWQVTKVPSGSEGRNALCHGTLNVNFLALSFAEEMVARTVTRISSRVFPQCVMHVRCFGGLFQVACCVCQGTCTDRTENHNIHRFLCSKGKLYKKDGKSRCLVIKRPRATIRTRTPRKKAKPMSWREKSLGIPNGPFYVTSIAAPF